MLRWFLASFLMPLLTPTATLFPYTTLFRSSALTGPKMLSALMGTGNGTPPQRGRRNFRSKTIPLSVCLAGPQLVLVGARSEEHTSELQSLAYLVCRLLLEKKK